VPLPWCKSQFHDQPRAFPRCCACRAATTALLSRQNPMARLPRAGALGRARGAEGRAPLDPLLHRADRTPALPTRRPAVPTHHGVGVQRASALVGRRARVRRDRPEHGPAPAGRASRTGPPPTRPSPSGRARAALRGPPRSVRGVGMAGPRVVQASRGMEDDGDGHATVGQSGRWDRRTESASRGRVTGRLSGRPPVRHQLSRCLPCSRSRIDSTSAASRAGRAPGPT